MNELHYSKHDFKFYFKVQPFLTLIMFTSFSCRFLVDETPLRIFRNYENRGITFFPKVQRQRIYASLWEADDWATQGGAIKTDWSKAPFTAYYRNFKIDTSPNGIYMTHDLNAYTRKRLYWVQKNYMIYNYCVDWKRFSQNFPPECKHAKFN